MSAARRTAPQDARFQHMDVVGIHATAITITSSGTDSVDSVVQQQACDCGGDTYNWVLNFAPVNEMPIDEWALAVAEVARHGFGTSYNSKKRLISLCITLARDACCVSVDQVKRGIDLGLSLVEPAPEHTRAVVQFVRFNLPSGPDSGFTEEYVGPAAELPRFWEGRDACTN